MGPAGRGSRSWSTQNPEGNGVEKEGRWRPRVKGYPSNWEGESAITRGLGGEEKTGSIYAIPWRGQDLVLSGD